MEIEAEIEKLRLESGDVLLIKTENNRALDGVRESSAVWKKSIPEGVHVLLVPKDIEITLIKEESMNKLGWLKADNAKGTDG